MDTPIEANDTVFIDKSMTLDFAGNTYSTTASYAFVADAATLTLTDSTATAEVTEDKIVETSGNSVQARRIGQAVNNGTIVIESGNYQSTDTAFWAGGKTEAGHVVMNGGYINAQEFGLAIGGEGSTLEVNDGIIYTNDNAIMGGNGSAGYGGTTMTINGGTFIGNIQSSGYIACGIYHPQAGTLTVNGGDFYINNGIGILMRGGEGTITGGTITTTGNASGKVGDSKVLPSCYGAAIDLQAKYPAVDSCRMDITGGTISVEEGVEVVTVMAEEGQNTENRLNVSGGIYSAEVDSEYIQEGYACIAAEDKYKVIAA